MFVLRYIHDVHAEFFYAQLDEATNEFQLKMRSTINLLILFTNMDMYISSHDKVIRLPEYLCRRC